jgi:hypothetical protein
MPFKGADGMMALGQPRHESCQVVIERSNEIVDSLFPMFEQFFECEINYSTSKPRWYTEA